MTCVLKTANLIIFDLIFKCSRTDKCPTNGTSLYLYNYARFFNILKMFGFKKRLMGSL